MKFINENGEQYSLVSDQCDLNELINLISKPKPFAGKFRFAERELFYSLLDSLKISYENFSKKYFFYDSTRKIHISESQFGGVWISTTGLVPVSKATTNRAVNACLNQYMVISLLLEKAIAIVEDERVYDIDSHSSGLLSRLSPAIFHNLTFYIEVFCKAYLSLTITIVPHTHSLTLLYKKTVDTMLNKKHNNSLFQILILDPLYKFVDHIGKSSGNFKEHFIKYDDNPLDDSVILFEHAALVEMTMILELSADFISEYFYRGNEIDYLESNIYQRMLDKAETEEKKKKIQEMYPHLAKG